jgi:integrase
MVPGSSSGMYGLRSFPRFVAFENLMYSRLVQLVLAIPAKRAEKRLVEFLAIEEIDALLRMPDRSTWLGRHDYALLLLAVQTGCDPCDRCLARRAGSCTAVDIADLQRHDRRRTGHAHWLHPGHQFGLVERDPEELRPVIAVFSEMGDVP